MMPEQDFKRLVETVQTNCHIVDARHAGDLTLCTYLMEMRELFRWERGMALTDEPQRADLGQWLVGREALWESLSGAEFAPLPVRGRELDPFVAPVINDLLVPRRAVYGGGIGRFGRPQFFLGQLNREEYRDGIRILVAGVEYARDLVTAPAFLQGDTIYLREESLRRWLWEKFEAWGIKKIDGPFAATLNAYEFHRDPNQALERMIERESETLVLHELGEHAAGRMLEPTWRELRAGLTSRRAEIVLRALRDNLADCLVTIPALLERDIPASLHFWFSNFDGLRLELFPRLATAYRQCCDGDKGKSLHVAVRVGRDHWTDICERLVEHYREHGSRVEHAIEAIIEQPQARL